MYMCVCVYVYAAPSLSIHLSVDVLVASMSLGIIECAAVNSGVHASFLLSSFKAYLPYTLS